MDAGAIVVFVATRRQDVPESVVRYASVDGSVPGAAVVWDHHVTGEPVSLDAMPAVVSLEGFDGLGTTLADTDAVVGAVVALLGGLERVPAVHLPALRAASWYCDHLRGAPGVTGEADRLGRGLHVHVSRALAVPRSETSPIFARLVREVHDAITSGRALPFAEEVRAPVRALRAEGRLTEHGLVALVDLRGLGESIDPIACYAQHRCPVAVTVADHGKGGTRYTVGVNPYVADAPADLRPALVAVARAEHAHGPPCQGVAPVPGNENWGGRATVFGSPWNYGSRLAPGEVVALVLASLPLASLPEFPPLLRSK
jgi:hypothetical protein